MNSLKQMTLFIAIALPVVLVISFILIPADNSIRMAPLPDDPNFLMLAQGSSYDESSKKILNNTVFKIPIDECDKQPTWDPATQELPVPLSELEKNAFKNALGPDEKTWAAWKVTNVEFSRFGWSGLDQEKARENRWSCELTLTNQDPDHYNFKTACMLLDGTYVPPQPR
jgi:hypothetical protein